MTSALAIKMVCHIKQNLCITSKVKDPTKCNVYRKEICIFDQMYHSLSEKKKKKKKSKKDIVV